MRAKLSLLLLAAFFVWGVATLTLLRFDIGAAYPPYSSFRADPLGTKALHWALAELDGVEVRRNFERLADLNVDPGTTVLLAGVREEALAGEDADTAWQTLRGLAGRGARVVVALAPRNSAWFLDEDESPPDEAAEEKDERRPGEKAGDADHGNQVLARPLVSFGFSALGVGDDDLPVPENANLALEADDPALLPQQLLCHTSVWFDRLEAGWRVVYQRGKLPIVIERRVGSGSLVLVADAVPLSNQGVRFSREPEYLAWLLGGARQVVFDETHLGVHAPAGSMHLMKRYRLQGVLATLLVLAILFAWRAATPLVAAAAHGETPAEITGRDAAAGIAGLLRRELPAKQLLAAAAESWRASTAPPPAVAAAVAALAQTADEPVAGYRRIRAVVHRPPHSPPRSHPGER
jgi:hypothetical protein